MTEKRKYTVGLVQMNMGPDPEANFARAIEHVREAASRGAKIVCLPELFKAQYFCQREDLKLFDLAEPIPGPSTNALAQVARGSKVSIVAAPTVSARAGQTVRFELHVPKLAGHATFSSQQMAVGDNAGANAL
jgi:predicted amidohydrolase